MAKDLGQAFYFNGMVRHFYFHTPHSDHSDHSVKNSFMIRTQSIIKATASVLLVSSLFMAGCAHLGHGPQEAQPSMMDNGSAVTTQYAPSSGVRTGFNTFEVYLRNDSDKPVRYGTPRLNGKPLLDLALSRVTAPADVKLDGVQIPFPRNAWHTDPLVVAILSVSGREARRNGGAPD